MTKSLPISKRMVYESYLKVTAKGGGAGIDKETIELFDQKVSDNLYKLWNRMTSGSYLPPSTPRVEDYRNSCAKKSNRYSGREIRLKQDRRRTLSEVS